MNVTSFLTRTSYALRGTDENAPTFGDDEAVYWLDLLNRKKDELYQDVTQNWRNVYEVRSLGTIAASAAPVFNLPSDFLAFAGDENSTAGAGGGAYIIKTDGNRVDVNVIRPQERDSVNRAVYVAGSAPEKLYFTTAIVAGEDIIGGTLYAPAYYLPADLTLAADVLPFLDPNWACLAVAAEVAFNDVTYEDKAPDINAKANNLFKMMLKKNKGQLHNAPQRVGYNIKPIRDTRTN